MRVLSIWRRKRSGLRGNKTTTSSENQSLGLRVVHTLRPRSGALSCLLTGECLETSGPKHDELHAEQSGVDCVVLGSRGTSEMIPRRFYTTIRSSVRATLVKSKLRRLARISMVWQPEMNGSASALSGKWAQKNPSSRPPTQLRWF